MFVSSVSGDIEKLLRELGQGFALLKFKQKFLLMTSVRNMPNAAGNVMSIRSWHIFFSRFLLEGSFYPPKGTFKPKIILVFQNITANKQSLSLTQPRWYVFWQVTVILCTLVKSGKN